MKKAGFKTFIISFVLSLFVILFINGLLEPTPSSPSQNLKISNKNITLFLKNEALAAAEPKIMPIKSQVLANLGIPEAIVKTDPNFIPLDFEPSIDDPGETPPSISVKKIDIAQHEPANDPPPTYLIASSPKDTKTKIVADFDKIIRTAPPIGREEIIVTKDHSPPLKIVKNEPAAFIKTEPEVSVLTASEKDAGKDDLFASAEAASLETETEPENLLIPLEKSHGTVFADTQIEIVKKADRNQVALASLEVPMQSLGQDTPIADPLSTANAPSKSNWQSMDEKNTAEDKKETWAVAKGTKYPRNSMVLDESFAKVDNEKIKKMLAPDEIGAPQDSIKIAEETVKNLLIPIPEEIMNDKNLTPQLVSSGKGQEIERRLNEQEKAEEDISEESMVSSDPAKDKKSSILSNITSIFSSKDKKGKTTLPQEDFSENVESDEEKEDGLFSNFRKTFSSHFNDTKILPIEIRLTFQPNRAEISGQTLKWLNAFADKIKEDSTSAIEIRIDGTSSRELQQKRLNLLHNILTNQGVEYSKIKIVFTQREPNSFIVRTIRINNQVMGGINKNNINNPSNYYMRW